MNKKFSTLVGCLLASTAFSTAVATDFIRPIEYRTAYVGAGITDPAATINHIKADQWYQLRTTLDLPGKPTGVLVHERDEYTGEVSLRVAVEANAPLLPSLWRIDYTVDDGVGGGKYRFVNKETNISISFDHTFAAFTEADGSIAIPEGAKWIMGDCSLNWEWYNNNKQSNKFAEIAPYAYLHSDRDSAMVMIMGNGGYVHSYKDAASKLLDNHDVKASVGALRFQPVIAKDITLSAQDFNSMIDFNKPSTNQYGQFLFFEPNGDLLNAKKMSPKTNGVMLENQEYEAQYDMNALDDIFKMAIEDLDGDYKYEDFQDRWIAARKAWFAVYGKEGAKADLVIANWSLSRAEGALKGAQRDYNRAESAYNISLESLSGKAFEHAMADADGASVHFGGLDDKILEGHLISWKLMDYVKSQSGNLGKLKTDAVNAKATLDKATGTIEKIEAALLLNKAVGEVISDLEADREKFLTIVAYNSFAKALNEYRTAFINATNSFTTGRHSDASLLARTKGDKVSFDRAAERKSSCEDHVETCEATVKTAKINFDKALAAYITAEGKFGTALAAWESTKYILEEGFLRLNYVESEIKRNEYLMVDTAFWQSKTQGQAIPSRSDLKIAHNIPKITDAAAIDARYFFKLTYFPTQDSLVIEPLNASIISNEEYAAKTSWKDSYVGNHFAYKGNVGEEAEAASNSWTTDKSPVAFKLEDLSTSDWCLTAATVNPEFDSWLKTRISFNNPYDYLVRATLAEGLYHIKATNNGKYVVANFEGDFQYDVPEEGIQNYNDMPATMFVVKKAGCSEADRVAIYNREYGFEEWPAFIGQLYKDEKGNLFTINRNYPHSVNSVNSARETLALKDDYQFIPVTDEDALTSDYHGYKHLDPETLMYTNYSLNYNWSLNDKLYLNVSDNGLLAYSEGANTTFEMDTLCADINIKFSTIEFGYGAGIAGLKQLKRNVYSLKVSDANLIDNDTTYVALVKEDGKNEYYTALGINEIRAGKGDLAMFYLKADQVNSKGEKAYVLIDIRNGNGFYLSGCKQAHCVDGNQRLSHVGLDNEPNERASAFALTENNRDLYKATKAAQNVNIFRTIGTTKQYLFEDNANKINVPNAKAGFGFLGLTQEDIKPVGNNTTALYIDEVVSSSTRMPQYMLAVAIDSVDNAKWCKDHGYNPGCEHEVFYNGYLAGRFLINLTDSVTKGTNLETNADKYKYQSFTRLGFVEGVHMNITEAEAEAMFNDKTKAGEFFFTLVGGTTLADLRNEQGYIIPSKLFDTKLTEAHQIEKGKHNNFSFSFRLLNDGSEDFFLESNLKGTSAIGSFKGAWVKEMNGVIVLAQTTTTTGDHNQNGGNIQEIVNQAQLFSMEDTDEVATDNEAIETATISVIATKGAVIVKGAAGKTVVINNVLGQTVANTVITSDEATIAVPAGVVVVAVEGEAAVKAIVK